MRELLGRIDKVFEGKGFDLSAEDVDRDQLIAGIKVEYEHIQKGKEKPADDMINKFLDGEHAGISRQDLEKLAKAQSIALDHLEEIADYYTRLDAMEKSAKAKA